MKITKRQLRRIIKEERARLVEEMKPDSSGVAKLIGSVIADEWWEDISAEEYEGTGPTWPEELEAAREEIEAKIGDRQLPEDAVDDLIASVEERLHNGDFAK